MRRFYLVAIAGKEAVCDCLCLVWMRARPRGVVCQLVISDRFLLWLNHQHPQVSLKFRQRQNTAAVRIPSPTRPHPRALVSQWLPKTTNSLHQIPARFKHVQCALWRQRYYKCHIVKNLTGRCPFHTLKMLSYTTCDDFQGLPRDSATQAHVIIPSRDLLSALIEIHYLDGIFSFLVKSLIK